VVVYLGLAFIAKEVRYHRESQELDLISSPLKEAPSPTID
jgi:hypothetical protein